VIYKGVGRRNGHGTGYNNVKVQLARASDVFQHVLLVFKPRSSSKELDDDDNLAAANDGV